MARQFRDFIIGFRQRFFLLIYTYYKKWEIQVSLRLGNKEQINNGLRNKKRAERAKKYYYSFIIIRRAVSEHFS